MVNPTARLRSRALGAAARLWLAGLTTLAACATEDPAHPTDRLCDSGIEFKTCDADRLAYFVGDSVGGTIKLQNSTIENVTDSLLLELRAEDGVIADAVARDFSVPSQTANTYEWGGVVAPSGTYVLVASATGCRCESKAVTVN